MIKNVEGPADSKFMNCRTVADTKMIKSIVANSKL